MTILGLTRSPTHDDLRPHRVRGHRTSTQLDAEQLRSVRGNEIAMIFQDPLTSLHPFHKVGKQLLEAILTHQDVSKQAARRRAVELLGLVGIPDPERRMDEYPHEFSGGMRQRVMIAMALVNDPKILIADEPTTALDVTIQAQILALIERLQDQLGMAVILITHDLGVIAESADEVARDVRRSDRRAGDARPDLLRPPAPLHLGAPRIARQAGPARASSGSRRSPASLRRSSPRRRAATSAPAARTLFERCTEVPELEVRGGEPGHADRCWLSGEQKRALRVVEEGRFGLETPAA